MKTKIILSSTALFGYSLLAHPTPRSREVGEGGKGERGLVTMYLIFGKTYIVYILHKTVLRVQQHATISIPGFEPMVL
jgi:hypothetical protein